MLRRLSYLFSVVSIAYILTYFLVFKGLDTRFSSFNSSPLIDASKAYAGYTLIAPYNRMANADSSYKGEIYLLDMLARPVKTWTTAHQALYSILKSNGNLLAVMEAPSYSQLYPPGGNTGRIQELDSNSKVVWEYENESMHHDIVPLPNGNVAVALWEKTPVDMVSKVAGGVAGTEMPGGVMWSDRLVEIDRNKKIVWSWSAAEHLDPSIDKIDPEMPRYAWTFMNGISYTDKNPIDGTPAYLVSYRSLDEIMFIRRSDGQVIWRSPAGMLNTQHDPTILANGNVMAFDNGFTRLPAPFPMYGSRVVEINPKTNKIVWQFNGGDNAIDKVRFFAPIVGGAQRLPNGNTLITDGPKGHVFEVTKEGKVVWDLVSPYVTKQTGQFPNNFIFKAKRYTSDKIKFASNLKPALNMDEFRLYNLLKRIYP